LPILVVLCDSHDGSYNPASGTSLISRIHSFPFFLTQGVKNLMARMKVMKELNPTFCDITWGAGGSTADTTLNIAEQMQKDVGVECMMHLTCTNMKKEMIDHALERCKEIGIRNILALRGDPPHGQDRWTATEGGFNCALDLVKYIKDKYGDYFGIAVAGYPEAHPEVIVEDPEEMKVNYKKDIDYLKSKIDAGADFIVTQLFYDAETFIQFVKDCREVGINCPILPGIMPIMNHGGFRRMTGFCKTKVPKEIDDKIEELKDDVEALKEYGIELGAQICRKILDAGACSGLHMYTLNTDKSPVSILQAVGMVAKD